MFSRFYEDFHAAVFVTIQKAKSPAAVSDIQYEVMNGSSGVPTLRIQLGDDEDAKTFASQLNKLYAISSKTNKNQPKSAQQLTASKYSIFLELDEVIKFYTGFYANNPMANPAAPVPTNFQLELGFQFNPALLKKMAAAPAQAPASISTPTTSGTTFCEKNEKRVLGIIREGRAFIKVLNVGCNINNNRVFPHSDLEFNLQQLSDPNANRPSRIGHKFQTPPGTKIAKVNPKTGQSYDHIVGESGKRKAGNYHHIKKTSTTLLPSIPECMTLFSEGIGFLWDADNVYLKNEKYLFPENAVTNDGFWLLTYENRMRSVSPKVLVDKNKNAVINWKKDGSKISHNEILACPPCGHPDAIFTNHNTLSSRLKALWTMYFTKSVLKAKHDIPVLIFNKDLTPSQVDSMGDDRLLYTHRNRLCDVLAVLTQSIMSYEKQLLCANQNELLKNILESSAHHFSLSDLANVETECKKLGIAIQDYLPIKIDTQADLNQAFKDHYNDSMDHLITALEKCSTPDLSLLDAFVTFSESNKSFSSPRSNAIIVKYLVKKYHFDVVSEFLANMATDLIKLFSHFYSDERVPFIKFILANAKAENKDHYMELIFPICDVHFLSTTKEDHLISLISSDILTVTERYQLFFYFLSLSKDINSLNKNFEKIIRQLILISNFTFINDLLKMGRKINADIYREEEGLLNFCLKHDLDVQYLNKILDNLKEAEQEILNKDYLSPDSKSIAFIDKALESNALAAASWLIKNKAPASKSSLIKALSVADEAGNHQLAEVILAHPDFDFTLLKDVVSSYQDLTVINKLFSFEKAKNSILENEKNIIQQAVECDNTVLIRAIKQVKLGQNYNESDTLLHLAVRDHDDYLVRQIAYENSIHAVNNEGHSPFDLAIISNQFMTAYGLIERGLDGERRVSSKNGQLLRTHLQQECQGRELFTVFDQRLPNLFGFLCANGSDITVCDEDGNSILQRALALPATEGCGYLKDIISCVDALTDQQKNDALHGLCEKGQFSLALMLLPKIHIVSCVTKHLNRTLLHYAAHHNLDITTTEGKAAFDLIDHLLKVNPAFISQLDADSQSALTIFIHKNRMDYIELLFSHAVHLSNQDIHDLLLFSIRQVDVFYINRIIWLEQRPVINQKGVDSPLHLLAQSAHLIPFILDLCKLGASLTVKNAKGMTPLSILLSQEKWTVIIDLLEHIKEQCDDETLLFVAQKLINKHYKAAFQFLSACHQIDLEKSRDSNGKTLLHRLVSEGGDTSLVKLLCEKVDNISQQDEQQHTAFILAARLLNWQSVLVFLEFSHKLSNTELYEVLWLAFQNYHFEAMKKILTLPHFELNAKKDEMGNTILHLLLGQAYLNYETNEIMELLIKKGASFTSPNKDSVYPFELFLRRKKLMRNEEEFIQSYIDKINLAEMNFNTARQLLLALCQANKLDLAMNLFVKLNNPELSSVSDKNGTLLHYAVRSQHVPFAQLLCQQGASIYTTHSYEKNPLSFDMDPLTLAIKLPAHKGRDKMVATLIKFYICYPHATPSAQKYVADAGSQALLSDPENVNNLQLIRWLCVNGHQEFSPVGKLLAYDKDISLEMVMDSCQGGSVKAKYSLLLNFIFSRINLLASEKEVIKFIQEIKKHASFLVEKQGFFGGHKWGNETLSEEGAFIYKAARNHILTIAEQSPAINKIEGEVKNFLEKNKSSVSSAMRLYTVFATKQEFKAADQQAWLNKNNKVKGWISKKV